MHGTTVLKDKYDDNGSSKKIKKKIDQSDCLNFTFSIILEVAILDLEELIWWDNISGVECV